jgi:Tfp pilus assembly protein PilF
MRPALLRFLCKLLSLGLCLSGAAIDSAPASPGTRPPSLDAALSQLQHADAAGAAKSLRRITSFDPQNAAVWRALGTADMMLKHFAAAVADYHHALKLQADSPRVFYQLGAAYAAMHDSRHAFEFLNRAQASHRYDMTGLPRIRIWASFAKIRASMPCCRRRRTSSSPSSSP